MNVFFWKRSWCAVSKTLTNYVFSIFISLFVSCCFIFKWSRLLLPEYGEWCDATLILYMRLIVSVFLPPLTFISSFLPLLSCLICIMPSLSPFLLPSKALSYCAFIVFTIIAPLEFNITFLFPTNLLAAFRLLLCLNNILNSHHFYFPTYTLKYSLFLHLIGISSVYLTAIKNNHLFPGSSFRFP